MAFISIKRELNRIYQKIDKIAKGGRDNFQEYYIYVDDLIFKQKYGLLTQVLYIKYNFDYSKYTSVDVIKQKSWSIILFNTNTKLQDDKYTLLKNNDIYQIGLDYYKQLPTTTAIMVDNLGSGAELNPIVENGGIVRIDVLNTGRNYSTASYVSITGGITPASASAFIRGGLVIKVDVIATGSSYNQDIKLGRIREVDVYGIPLDVDITDSAFQELKDNKTMYLSVDKIGVTQSASFSTWDYTFTYDKNVINLYKQAIDYLI